jgi:hypothetical protein
MLTAAEQYRALVEKLEAINPSEEQTLAVEIDPATGQPISNTVPPQK